MMTDIVSMHILLTVYLVNWQHICLTQAVKDNGVPMETPSRSPAGPASAGNPEYPANAELVAESASRTNQGDKFLEAGKLDVAADCYRAAISIHPGNASALSSLGMICLQQDLYKDAEHYLNQAILAAPHMAKAYYFLGATLQKQGKLNNAAENFSKALDLLPDAEFIHRDLCYIYSQLGLVKQAKAIVLRALDINPNAADFHFFLGNLHGQEKNFDEAITCYQKALEIQPDYAEALSNLGKIFQEQGKLHDAAASFRQALQLRPDLPDIHINLGNIFKHQGEVDEAINWYQKALAINPDFADAHLQLGDALKIRGHLDEAIGCYQMAIQIDPNFATPYSSLADTLQMQGKLDEAVNYYQLAIKLTPDSVGAYNNLGNTYLELGRHDEAMASYEKAITIKPDFVEAQYNLGILCDKQQRLSEAISCFQQVLELDPDHHAARANLLHDLQHICQWDNLDATASKVRQAALDQAPHTFKNQLPPLVFLALPGTTADIQKHSAEKYVLNKFQPYMSLRKNLGFDYKIASNKKISVGYISGDFRAHAVSVLMAEVFELHDRDRFHVTAYSYGQNDNSEMSKRVRAAFDRFIDIRTATYVDAAKQINDDGIDILVDLAGHTTGSRTEILALRPAPIQVNYLGYPGTMGADFIDYMIADRFTIPAEKLTQYTEKISWLPDCFQANDSLRPHPSSTDRSKWSLPAGKIIFCCFNQTYKITPEIFTVWCNLLKAVPDSLLWLPASNQKAESNLKRETESRGVSAHRFVMAPLLPYRDHLERLQCADLFLDTLPFNAGTTCSDALWMGVPVITCAGDTFVSRMAGSLLTAIGVPELITYNLNDYYSLALDLATNKEKRENIRRRIISNQETAPLFNSEKFTRNLEAAYLRMHATHNESKIMS